MLALVELETGWHGIGVSFGRSKETFGQQHPWPFNLLGLVLNERLDVLLAQILVVQNQVSIVGVSLVPVDHTPAINS